MKILLVDDNKGITDLLSEMLKIEGHECIVAGDGKNSLVLLQKQKFDVTILDINMPYFSGLDVIDSLEQSGKLDEQKIVVLSAAPIPDEKLEELEKRGVHACLRKPVDIDLLLEVLKN